MEIIFPLSPKILLFYYDPNVYKISAKKVYLVDTKNESDINHLNMLQYINCSNNLYFNNSISRLLIDKLEFAAAKFRTKGKANVKIYNRDLSSQERKDPLIVLSKVDYKCKLSLDFTKILRKSKRHIIDKKAIYLRNEIICRHYSKFIQLVDQSKYRPMQFRKYLEDIGYY